MKKSFKPKGKELVNSSSNLPTDFNMENFAGVGAEDIGVEDLPRPSLKLLQALSPECTIGKEEFIDIAKPGMFFNAANRQLYKGAVEDANNLPELVFIPVKYTRREIEFQRNRGGFVAEHLPGSSITDNIKVIIDEQDKKHRITTNNTELVDVSIFYGLIIDPENIEPIQAIISLSSSAKKFSKNFNAYLRGLKDKNPQTNTVYTPPLFSRAYTLTSVIVNDAKGSYYTWKFKLNQKLDVAKPEHGALVKAALDYVDLINADLVNVDHSKGEN